MATAAAYRAKARAASRKERESRRRAFHAKRAAYHNRKAGHAGRAMIRAGLFLAAALAALFMAGPAAAELPAGHFHAVPGTLADLENKAAALVQFVTGGGLFVSLFAVALAGPVAVALVSFMASRK